VVQGAWGLHGAGRKHLFDLFQEQARRVLGSELAVGCGMVAVAWGLWRGRRAFVVLLQPGHGSWHSGLVGGNVGRVAGTCLTRFGLGLVEGGGPTWSWLVVGVERQAE
jgi:hypothetical protein